MMKSNVVGGKITSDVKIDKAPGRMKETASCSFNPSRVRRCIPPVGRAVTPKLQPAEGIILEPEPLKQQSFEVVWLGSPSFKYGICPRL